MQTTIDLIAKHMPDSEKNDISKFKIYPNCQCAVTGSMTDCIERKKLLGGSFTTQSTLAFPGSDYVSLNAFYALKYRPERGSSWIVSEKEFKKLSRVEIRPLVLRHPGFKTWSGYATTSYKKHGSVLSPVNNERRAVWVFETLIVDCSDNEKVNEIYNKLCEYQLKGFGRTIFESCEIPSYLIAKLGLQEWLEFESWARPIFKSNLYQFLCYLLPSQAELKENGLQKEPEIKEKKGQIDLW